MTEHEKRIREALTDPTQGNESAILQKADLRALLADLDAVRGALEAIVNSAAAGQAAIIEHLVSDAHQALKGATAQHTCSDVESALRNKYVEPFGEL